MHYFDPIFNLGLTIYFIKQIYVLYKIGLIILIFSDSALNIWIIKQTNCAYITLYTVLITYCAIKTSAQSTKATGEKRHKIKMI